jgi:hypothetical protein
MNEKLLLSLVAIPTLTGSMLTMLFVHLAYATQTSNVYQASALAPEAASCSVPVELMSGFSAPGIRSPHDGTLMASAIEIPVEMPPEQPLEYPVLDFSEAESDAAVALFGCDCPACINALRQLRRQPPAPMVLTSRRLAPTNPSSSPFVSDRPIAPIRQDIPGSQLIASNQVVPVSDQDLSHSVQGHCWVNLQRRSTLEDIQNVLQDLEAEEASQD